MILLRLLSYCYAEYLELFSLLSFSFVNPFATDICIASIIIILFLFPLITNNMNNVFVARGCLVTTDNHYEPGGDCSYCIFKISRHLIQFSISLNLYRVSILSDTL